MKAITHSIEETHAFAAKIASELLGGEVLALKGDLGTGKTEFVRGLAQALKSLDPVLSPSFTLLNLYRTNHETIKHLVHVDFYRLLDRGVRVRTLEDIGLDEWLNRTDAVIVIEWPTDLLNTLFKTKELRFSLGDSETDRVIER